MKILALLALAPLLLAASPSKEKVLVLPLTAGEGVTAGTAQAVTDALLAEVRKRPVSVISAEDVKAVLSVERQRQMLGCSESGCMAELGGALGVDRIVGGSLARLGTSWLLHVQLIDAQRAKVLAQADRRKKGGSIDDVLDELPGMAAELFGAAAPARPAVPVPAPVALPTAAPAQLPPPWAEVPLELAAEVRAKLVALSDGHGHALAVVPFVTDGPLFAGEGTKLFAQPILGGGSNGTQSFEISFW